MGPRVIVVLFVATLPFLSTAAAQEKETFERRVDRVERAITAKINTPDVVKIRFFTKEIILIKVKIKKDGTIESKKDETPCAIACLSHSKKFLWFKWSVTPTILINKWWCFNLSDEALMYIVAHELGHYFDDGLMSEKTLPELQDFADTFALYALGEDVFRKGLFQYQSQYLYNQLNSEQKMLVKSNLDSYNNLFEWAQETADRRLEQVKSNVGQVPEKIRLRQEHPLKN